MTLKYICTLLKHHQYYTDICSSSYCYKRCTLPKLSKNYVFQSTKMCTQLVCQRSKVGVLLLIGTWHKWPSSLNPSFAPPSLLGNRRAFASYPNHSRHGSDRRPSGCFWLSQSEACYWTMWYTAASPDASRRRKSFTRAPSTTPCIAAKKRVLRT